MAVVHLRHTASADLAFVTGLERHPDNRAFISAWTELEHAAALANPDIAHFIVGSAAGLPIGFAICAGLRDPNRCIELRRMVIDAKGQGYGRAALEALVALAFDQFHAHRVWLDVIHHNLRAQHLYCTHGFQQEGTLRECIQRDTGFDSLIVMSMLRREYEAARGIASGLP